MFKQCFYLLFLFTSSCQYLPDVAKDVENIATDTAIKIEVSKETFSKETNLDINVSVQNKDEPQIKTNEKGK